MERGIYLEVFSIGEMSGRGPRHNTTVRHCAFPGCTARLSGYNKADICRHHPKPEKVDVSRPHSHRAYRVKASFKESS
ncbi:MAG: hypothetical protein AAB421_02935 [Patescibacteria group bacterium]